MLPPQPLKDKHNPIHQNGPIRSSPLASVVHVFRSLQEVRDVRAPRLESPQVSELLQHSRPRWFAGFRSRTSRLLSYLGSTDGTRGDPRSSTSTIDTLLSSMSEKEIKIWPFFTYTRKPQQDPWLSSSSLSSHRSPEEKRTQEFNAVSSSTHKVDKKHLTSSHDTPPLHRDLQAVVDLHNAHARKFYMSGPLLRLIEKDSNGRRPLRDAGWTDVWAQLNGTDLSMWDVKATKAASQQGTEVPPAYVNITDAVVHALGSITMPPTADSPARKYSNILVMNTAGSNLILFSCPSTASLISWVAAVRLSTWEKSRIEEIYTGYLIRRTLHLDAQTPSAPEQVEGRVWIRFSGQTDWKRLWMRIHRNMDTRSYRSPDASPSSTSMARKRLWLRLLSKDSEPPTDPIHCSAFIALYASSKSKDRRKPLLTMTNVTQAYAIYPAPESSDRSTLMKVEGLLGTEEMAGKMKEREGNFLVMLDLDKTQDQTQAMLKWIVEFHTAFELYGKPRPYSWNPYDPSSPMFAFPTGPRKDLLFLDRASAESIDPRDERKSVVHPALVNIILDRMRSLGIAAAASTQPELAVRLDHLTQGAARSESSPWNVPPGAKIHADSHPPFLDEVNPDLQSLYPSKPDISDVHQLYLVHAQKKYLSGPLKRCIVAQPDGKRPRRNEGWTDAWAQLNGTKLTVWITREIEEAARQGGEVSPTYINVNHALVNILGPVTIQGTGNFPAVTYNHALMLNTAGSDILLFNCPSAQARISWVAALRLAAWEKSRLEEIFTAYLIRKVLHDGPRKMPRIVQGHVEGWVMTRLAGRREWKRVWMVVSHGDERRPPRTLSRRVRYPRKHKQEASSGLDTPTNASTPAVPLVKLYASPETKDKMRPLLTLSNVTQAFAVYTERPDLVESGTGMNIEGLVGEEPFAQTMRGREGWLLVIPEPVDNVSRNEIIVMWLTGIHDAFELYGRPREYTWDRRDPSSLMFACPIGPRIDHLFLDRQAAETLPLQEVRVSVIRSKLLKILTNRMQAPSPRPDAGPSSIPIGTSEGDHRSDVADPQINQLL